jgi:hypothetical protein
VKTGLLFDISPIGFRRCIKTPNTPIMEKKEPEVFVNQNKTLIFAPAITS